MNLHTTDVASEKAVVIPGPRLDAYAALVLRQRILDAVSTEPSVALDLSQIDFIDSSGLGLLVAAARKIGRGAKLRLRGVNSRNVATLLSITGLSSVFDVHGAATSQVIA